MSVFVDQARNRFGRMIMCHMVAYSLEELHAMAEAIGMRREWFQERSFPHYDVCQMRREKAVELGAVEVGRRDLAQFMRAKRTGTDHNILCTAGYGQLGPTLRSFIESEGRMTRPGSAGLVCGAAPGARNNAARRVEGQITEGNGQLVRPVNALK